MHVHMYILHAHIYIYIYIYGDGCIVWLLILVVFVVLSREVMKWYINYALHHRSNVNSNRQQMAQSRTNHDRITSTYLQIHRKHRMLANTTGGYRCQRKASMMHCTSLSCCGNALSKKSIDDALYRITHFTWQTDQTTLKRTSNVPIKKGKLD